MENFSFYLTFDPKDYFFNTDSKLILSKSIPLQLYLDNYEVALTEISSTEIFLNHRQFIYINIKNKYLSESINEIENITYFKVTQTNINRIKIYFLEELKKVLDFLNIKYLITLHLKPL